LVLVPEATEFIVGRGGLPLTGEGIGAVVAKGVPPVPDAVDADANRRATSEMDRPWSVIMRTAWILNSRVYVFRGMA
jgi:hypothetical protein